MSIVAIEKRGAIAILRLTRPEMMNALGAPGDGAAIEAACAELNADQSIRVIVLTGEGKCFSAGGDIKAMAERSGAFAGSGVDIREGYRTNIHRAARALYGLQLPVIAAVNGPARSACAISEATLLACSADRPLACKARAIKSLSASN